jgi:hypothetical protein
VLTPDPESCTSQTRRWVAFFFFCFVFFLDEYMFLLLSPRATNRTLEALDAILKPHANCRIARLSNFERWIRAHASFSGAAAEAAVAAAVADRGARCSESSMFPPCEYRRMLWGLFSSLVAACISVNFFVLSFFRNTCNWVLQSSPRSTANAKKNTKYILSFSLPKKKKKK